MNILADEHSITVKCLWLRNLHIRDAAEFECEAGTLQARYSCSYEIVRIGATRSDPDLIASPEQ